MARGNPSGTGTVARNPDIQRTVGGVLNTTRKPETRIGMSPDGF